MHGHPSVAYGLAAAVRLWRLVGAVWLVSMVVFLPAHAVLMGAAWDTLASLPEGGLPRDEAAVLAVELLRPVWPALAAAVVSGWLALWAWTVLWHAGAVRWLLFAGRSEVRLAEILGHGVLGWWRWARLALTAAAALAGTCAGLWLARTTVVEWSFDTGREPVWLAATAVAAALGLVAAVVTWLATLRGAWLLGLGDRRSVVLAWLAGLVGTLRQPLQSLATLAVWALPGVAAVVAPLAAGWRLEALRGGLPGGLVEVAAGLAGAFCWVALYLSFAPVTGLVGADAAPRQPSDRPS